MTSDDAITTLRRLEAEASVGWVYGYDPNEVARLATEAVTILSAQVEAAPDPSREYRRLMALIFPTQPVFKATVPRKRRPAEVAVVRQFEPGRPSRGVPGRP